MMSCVRIEKQKKQKTQHNYIAYTTLLHLEVI